jgi:hypothetical protein
VVAGRRVAGRVPLVRRRGKGPRRGAAEDAGKDLTAWRPAGLERQRS